MGRTVKTKNLQDLFLLVLLGHPCLHDREEVLLVLKNHISLDPNHLKVVNVSLLRCDIVTKIDELGDLRFRSCGFKSLDALDELP